MDPPHLSFLRPRPSRDTRERAGVFPRAGPAQRVEAVVWGEREDLSALAGTTRVFPGGGWGLGVVSGRAGFVSATALMSRRSGVAGRIRAGVSVRAAERALLLQRARGDLRILHEKQIGGDGRPNENEAEQKKTRLPRCHNVNSGLAPDACGRLSGWLRESVSERLSRGGFAGRGRGCDHNRPPIARRTAQHGKQRVAAGGQPAWSSS